MTLIKVILRRFRDIITYLILLSLGHTASLAAWMLYNRQQANFGALRSGKSLQFRTTEYRAGSRWALPCI